ncbi:MAG: ShlB/FhaC/HecB family hemolysin secretion/activation protein [Rhodospirillaceae bacterium]|nr:ShlB/FhaC/HecB family hemolysin secretion/activation protein [Rhodospirillaceae bacterium]
MQVYGATVYPESELAVIYEPYLGRMFGIADAEKIVAAITAKYQKDGYVLSVATAQPQDMEYGILSIDVVEGFIERVKFEGPMEARKDLLSDFAEKLKAARPLTQGILERYVMLMDDLPGLGVRPALRALDQASGAHELVLRLKQDDFEGYASVDNKSTRPVGRHVTQLSTSFNSLLGQYERTALVVYTVPDNIRELLFLEGQQEYPLNSEGTMVGIDAWHSVSESGESNDPLDLDSFDTRAAIYLVHPVIRRREVSLFLTGTFEYHDTEESLAGANTFDDRIRSLRLTARGFFADPLAGDNILIATASHGLDILDASTDGAANLSRTGGEVDYRKIEAYYTRYQALPGPWSAELGLKGQYMSDGALSGEEFRAGGNNFGRAYDPSKISGDYGAAGYLELQRNIAARNGFFLSTQAFAFYDLAAAWDKDPSFGTSRGSIASTGLGVRTLLPKDLRLTLEMGKPLTAPVFAEGRQGDHMRFFFSLNAGF